MSRRLTADQRARKQASDRAYRARKVAEAKAAGLPAAVGYGKAKRAGLPSVSELRRTGKLPARPAPRPPRALRRTAGPGGSESIRTGSQATATATVKAAAGAGTTVAIRGTFQTKTGWRQVTLDGKSNGQRKFIGDLAAGAGSVEPGADGKARVGRLDTPSRRGGRDSAKVIEIRTGAGGIDADTLWAAWLAYDGTWWDFLADWADSEYE